MILEAVWSCCNNVPLSQPPSQPFPATPKSAYPLPLLKKKKKKLSRKVYPSVAWNWATFARMTVSLSHHCSFPVRGQHFKACRGVAPRLRPTTGQRNVQVCDLQRSCKGALQNLLNSELANFDQQKVVQKEVGVFLVAFGGILTQHP